MGAWGVGIFSNDAGADLREDLRDLIAGGMTADEATARLVAEYGVGSGGNDDNDFWLALAAAQHRIGHVAAGVIERALEIIDDPAELERWAPRDRNRRASTLTKLKSSLETDPPAPKRLRPRQLHDTNLVPGQHVVVPLLPDQRSVLLRVHEISQDRGGRHACAVALEWNGSERRLKRAHRLRPMLNPFTRQDDEGYGFLLAGEPGDPPDLRILPVVSDHKTPARRRNSRFVTPWSDLHRFFDEVGNPSHPLRSDRPSP